MNKIQSTSRRALLAAALFCLVQTRTVQPHSGTLHTAAGATALVGGAVVASSAIAIAVKIIARMKRNKKIACLIKAQRAGNATPAMALMRTGLLVQDNLDYQSPLMRNLIIAFSSGAVISVAALVTWLISGALSVDSAGTGVNNYNTAGDDQSLANQIPVTPKSNNSVSFSDQDLFALSASIYSPKPFHEERSGQSGRSSFVSQEDLLSVARNLSDAFDSSVSASGDGDSVSSGVEQDSRDSLGEQDLVPASQDDDMPVRCVLQQEAATREAYTKMKAELARVAPGTPLPSLATVRCVVQSTEPTLPDSLPIAQVAWRAGASAAPVYASNLVAALRKEEEPTPAQKKARAQELAAELGRMQQMVDEQEEQVDWKQPAPQRLLSSPAVADTSTDGQRTPSSPVLSPSSAALSPGVALVPYSKKIGYVQREMQDLFGYINKLQTPGFMPPLVIAAGVVRTPAGSPVHGQVLPKTASPGIPGVQESYYNSPQVDPTRKLAFDQTPGGGSPRPSEQPGLSFGLDSPQQDVVSLSQQVAHPTLKQLLGPTPKRKILPSQRRGKGDKQMSSLGKHIDCQVSAQQIAAEFPAVKRRNSQQPRRRTVKHGPEQTPGTKLRKNVESAAAAAEIRQGVLGEMPAPSLGDVVAADVRQQQREPLPGRRKRMVYLGTLTEDQQSQAIELAGLGSDASSGNTSPELSEVGSLVDDDDGSQGDEVAESGSTNISPLPPEDVGVVRVVVSQLPSSAVAMEPATLGAIITSLADSGSQQELRQQGLKRRRSMRGRGAQAKNAAGTEPPIIPSLQQPKQMLSSGDQPSSTAVVPEPVAAEPPKLLLRQKGNARFSGRQRYDRQRESGLVRPPASATRQHRRAGSRSSVRSRRSSSSKGTGRPPEQEIARLRRQIDAAIGSKDRSKIYQAIVDYQEYCVGRMQPSRTSGEDLYRFESKKDYHRAFPTKGRCIKYKPKGSDSIECVQIVNVQHGKQDSLYYTPVGQVHSITVQPVDDSKKLISVAKPARISPDNCDWWQYWDEGEQAKAQDNIRQKIREQVLAVHQDLKSILES